MIGQERHFVRWLQQATQRPPLAGSLGVGDDMAVLPTSGRVLLSTDMLLDGTHFDTSSQDYASIGRKAAGCGLSDCAAMAVRPVAALISIACPRHSDFGQLQQLMSGIIAICGEFDCAVVGGDTTSWQSNAGRLAIDVALVAEPFPGVEPVRRAGARTGDGIFVTGLLGGSLLGKHLAFTPRIDEARRIAEQLGPRLHAMIDVTDGLAIDLDRIAEASGVGAVLETAAVLACASEAAHAASRSDGRSVLDHILGDGEDFELLLAAEITEQEAQDLGLRRVGRLVGGAGLSLRAPDSSVTTLPPTGYEHL